MHMHSFSRISYIEGPVKIRRTARRQTEPTNSKKLMEKRKEDPKLHQTIAPVTVVDPKLHQTIAPVTVVDPKLHQTIAPVTVVAAMTRTFTGGTFPTADLPGDVTG